ncbi:CFAP58 [Symbiodinium sp. CCMP2592]|nr:CFAP58 [Symbiodinium sp. CCMP2592]
MAFRRSPERWANVLEVGEARREHAGLEEGMTQMDSFDIQGSRGAAKWQPGPEVAEQLSWYSQNLKEKTGHMKQMTQELEMYHNQVQDLKEEIERHNKDFQGTKQAYFQMLRAQLKSQSQAMSSQVQE